MDGLRVAFVGVLVVSVSLGGVTVADFGSYLGAVDTTGVIKEQVSAELVEVSLTEEGFLVTVRFENPTGVDLRVLGSNVRVHNASDQRIASGAGQRVDGEGDRLPARGSLTAVYEVGIADSGRGHLRGALRTDARISMSVGLQYDDVRFSISQSDLDASAVYREDG